jgi:predicted transcriptional regulator
VVGYDLRSCYKLRMSKLLDQAIAKVHELAEEDQDAIAVAVLSMVAADASTFPIDAETRAAIREGLAQAERGEFVDDQIVADADKRHGI